ncbi:autotransporter domain-containing protein [Pseudomonas sp. SMV71]|uniref:autotransporter outer membrane beta-barrel domain-containing protein n=1 Tax=Pseudomonas sp. SMV71 TaxID=3390195 RepID=UPI003F859515
MAQPLADIPTTAELQGRLKAFAEATDTHPSKNLKPHKDGERLTDINDLAILNGRGKFVGAVDGGGGTNMLKLDIAKGGKLEEARHFEGLHLTKGEWQHTGRFAGWAVIEPKTTLVNSGHIEGPIGVLGTLDNQGVLANRIIVEPEARMTNTGTVTGRVEVREKAWFGGNGTVEWLNVAGQLEIGPQTGAPSVVRDLSLSETANLIHRVNAEGHYATLDVGGTARLGNATLTVTGVAGDAIENGAHTVIRANAIEGEFGEVVNELAFMDANADYLDKEVRLIYTRNYVPVTLAATTENGQSFVEAVEDLQPLKPTVTEPIEEAIIAEAAAAPAETKATATPLVETLQAAAQASVAPAQTAQPQPEPNTAINALLGTNLTTAADAIDQLTGYDVADLGNATLSSITPIGTGVLAAMGRSNPQGAHGNGQVWVQAIGNSGRIGKHLDDYALKHSTTGVLLGTDWAISPAWRLGIAGGKSETRLDGYRFDGGLDSWHVGAYALRQDGPLALRLGAVYGNHEGNTKRHVDFNGFNDRLKGRYDASTQQVFGQIGYNLDVGHFDIEPYVQLGYQRYQRDHFTEKGGDAALQFEGQTQDHYTSGLGLHLARAFVLDQGTRLIPRLNVGWKHLYGDIRGSSRQRLVDGGKTYTVEGIELDRDSLQLEAALDLAVSPRHTLGLSYKGETGQDNRNGALMGQWRMVF